MRITRRLPTAQLAAATLTITLFLLTVASCSRPASEPGTGGPDELFGEVASFETVANAPSRLMVGLSTVDGRVLAGGDVTFEIKPATAKGPTIRSVAHYVSVPGLPAVPVGPRIGRMSQGIGVYAAEPVTIPSAGYWTVHVVLAGALAKQHPEASFEALTAPRVPVVGDAAPRTRNLTVNSPGVDPRWLDSAETEDSPPDPLLHSTVIADSIERHRPVVVVVSTPAFCKTRFCGFTLDAIRELALRDKNAGSPRDYVHLEVWQDYEHKIVNKAAAEWILPHDAEGREPWVFLVGSDGRIAARFDNVAPTDQLTVAVDALH